MAKTVTLSINTTDINDKKQVTNVSNVNPQATNANLLQFAQILVALTTDTYVSAMKITKESVI